MFEDFKNESMVDVAYYVIKEKGQVMPFNEIWNEVASKMELTEEEKEEKISLFYTNLTIDGRFVILGNNEWDLRENQPYSKVHIDMNDVYSDIDEEDAEEFDEDEEEEELDIEKEYSDDSTMDEEEELF